MIIHSVNDYNFHCYRRPYTETTCQEFKHLVEVEVLLSKSCNSSDNNTKDYLIKKILTTPTTSNKNIISKVCG